MYAYYGFTALDVKLNALRIMMTSLQIIQLFSGNVVAAFLPNVPCYASSSNLMFTWAINNIYIITLLFLFANFYKNNYLSKKSKDAAKAKAKKEEIVNQKSE
jgi:phosphotransferase system  glucose/maltose/N-acetylglucosamine-specific IIC component